MIHCDPIICPLSTGIELLVSCLLREYLDGKSNTWAAYDQKELCYQWFLTAQRSSARTMLEEPVP